MRNPFLVGYGFRPDGTDWLSKGKEDCGLCKHDGESDHDWLHCLYLWATSEKGRKWLGDDKAAARAKDLFASPAYTVRELLGCLPAIIQPQESADHLHGDLCCICDEIDLDGPAADALERREELLYWSSPDVLQTSN